MKTEITEQERQAIEEAAEKFCEYRRLHSNGYPPMEWFKAGAEFALSELRKPSEDLISVIIDAFSSIINQCEKVTSGNYSHSVPTIKGIAIRNIEYLKDFYKSQENSVNIVSQPWPPEPKETTYADISSKPSQSQENAVNAELLEAAKYFRDAWNCEWSKLTAKINDVNKHNTAISSAEKQLKL